MSKIKIVIGISLSNFKTYYKAIIVKKETLKKTDTWTKGIEQNQETNTETDISKWFSTKVQRPEQKKDHLFNSHLIMKKGINLSRGYNDSKCVCT